MIELKQIETSGNQALCGYYSMANYIMTLPYNLRIKFYEELLKKLNENSPASIVGLKKKSLELFISKQFKAFENNISKDSKKFESFERDIGFLLSEFGKEIVKTSMNQLLDGSDQQNDQSAIDDESSSNDIEEPIKENSAESFITAENLKKTFKVFFPNQDMAMSQEIENINLKPQTTEGQRQTITTESPTHSNPRLQSITNIVDAKCQELVPRKSDSLDDFLSKTADQQDEILFYLLLKKILNPLKIKDQIFNCPLTYDRYDKYFRSNNNEYNELIINALRELIDFKDLSGQKEKTIITQILDDNLGFRLKAQVFVKNILENLTKQFSFYSFRFKFLSSNPFCVSNDHSLHYTTMIDSKRSQELLSNVSLQYDLSLSTKSNEQKKISQMMIDDLFEKSKQSYGEFTKNAEVQRASDLELIKIYRSTEIFPRYNGRNNDIIRCKKSVNEVENVIENTLEELKKKHNMSDEELVLAIAIAKTFGGIGSALGQIKNKIDGINAPLQNQAEQNQVEKNFFQLCGSIFTQTNRKKFCKFSADFQKECQKKGIYSGRQELTDQQARNYGCRLTFVPDEVFAFHFNALPYKSKTRQIIDQYIASHQRHKAFEVGPATSLRDGQVGGVLRYAGSGR
ncbi:hypothetical protein LBMAG18_00810 [Alphaproteobacteria bacterium]|nr:hypothetical protein LBMAG18_00810 [Alphaproteobacteria bacterium]